MQNIKIDNMRPNEDVKTIKIEGLQGQHQQLYQFILDPSNYPSDKLNLTDLHITKNVAEALVEAAKINHKPFNFENCTIYKDALPILPANITLEKNMDQNGQKYANESGFARKILESRSQ